MTRNRMNELTVADLFDHEGPILGNLHGFGPKDWTALPKDMCLTFILGTPEATLLHETRLCERCWVDADGTLRLS